MLRHKTTNYQPRNKTILYRDVRVFRSLFLQTRLALLKILRIIIPEGLYMIQMVTLSTGVIMHLLQKSASRAYLENHNGSLRTGFYAEQNTSPIYPQRTYQRTQATAPVRPRKMMEPSTPPTIAVSEIITCESVLWSDIYDIMK